MADVSPDLFIDGVVAYQQTAAIKAAVELDLISEVARGHQYGRGARETNRSCRARHPHSLRLPHGPWPP